MIHRTQSSRLATMFLALSLCGLCRADLADRINRVIQDNRKVEFGIRIVRADSGEVLFAYRDREPMVPASNLKLVTTAAALRTLGPNFEFRTEVGLCGETLVIVGSGDPLLGDAQTDQDAGREPGWLLEDIACKLHEVGIQKVQDIVLDSTVFDDQRVHPDWPVSDLNRDYACEVCGLNYNGNCIRMTVTNVNGTARVAIEPGTAYVTYTSQVRVTSSPGAVGAYRIMGQPNTLVVKGHCRRQQGPFQVAIERPAVYFGFVLAEHLKRSGIEIGGQLIERTFVKDETFRSLSLYRTTLAQCLQRCNKDSFNLAAECLLKTLAVQASSTRRNGSWAAGTERIGRFLQDLGVDTAEFSLDDGCGLSRENRISANALTRVLLSMYRSPDWHLYRDSLAVGGEDGTISSDFRSPEYRGRVLAKTGYINQVRAFSGLCETDDGPVLFSILTNKANGLKPVVNQIVQEVLDGE